MDRVEIKNKAKEMIKDNKWFIWKPIVIFGLALAIIEGIAFGLDSALGLTTTKSTVVLGIETTQTTPGAISIIVGIFTGLASAAFSVGYAKYVLAFIRGKKLEFRDIIEFMKKHWVVAFLVGLVTGLIILGGTILFVIPGIIAAIGLMFYQEVCADNPTMKTMEIVKKSWEMTKGHKMDIFVFVLSFLGWEILATLTFGILYIWLMPYMVVAMTLLYEKLK